MKQNSTPANNINTASGAKTVLPIYRVLSGWQISLWKVVKQLLPVDHEKKSDQYRILISRLCSWHVIYQYLAASGKNLFSVYISSYPWLFYLFLQIRCLSACQDVYYPLQANKNKKSSQKMKLLPASSAHHIAAGQTTIHSTQTKKANKRNQSQLISNHSG